jgi:hypothetical protein
MNSVLKVQAASSAMITLLAQAVSHIYLPLHKNSTNLHKNLGHAKISSNTGKIKIYCICFGDFISSLTAELNYETDHYIVIVKLTKIFQ